MLCSTSAVVTTATEVVVALSVSCYTESCMAYLAQAALCGACAFMQLNSAHHACMLFCYLIGPGQLKTSFDA